MTNDLDQRITAALERGKRETAKRNAVLNRWLLRQGRMTIRDKQEARARGYREGYDAGMAASYRQPVKYVMRFKHAAHAPKPRLRTRLWRSALLFMAALLMFMAGSLFVGAVVHGSASNWALTGLGAGWGVLSLCAWARGRND